MSTDYDDSAKSAQRIGNVAMIEFPSGFILKVVGDRAVWEGNPATVTHLYDVHTATPEQIGRHLQPRMFP